MRSASLCRVVFAAAALGGSLCTPFAHAAAVVQDRGPVNRTLQGKVTDKDGNPAKGAVVYLKDQRSSAIKSAVAEDDGSYRFVQLSQGTDYEVWAKVGESKGPSKSISSFDSKQQLVLNLKVD